MTGEPREDMDTPLSDRLPPVVTSRQLAASSDAALAGTILPPYRPGLYSGSAPHDTVSALTAALESPADVGPPVAEGWPAAWRDDPMPAAGAASLDEGAASDTERWEDAAADEPAEWEAAVPEPSEQVAEELAVPPAQPDQADVWAWDAEETVVYDLPGAAAEDTGPWQDTWAAAPVGDEAGSVESAADEAEPSGDVGPEPVGDVQEWLEAGAVESYGWDLGEETPAGFAAAELPASSVDEEAAEPWAETPGLDALAEPLPEQEPDGWMDAQEGAETGAVIEMVEESGAGPALEFAPAEAAADEEVADERVAIVPPTPLDSWYHGEHGAEAEATWEAFGRALEEAASWGDLDTTIATGLAPEEARGEVERAPAAEAPVPDPAPDTSAVDAAVTDLASRLEHLARRLRAEGEKGVEHAMTEGDRLEASLAGFIAGYVAARRG